MYYLYCFIFFFFQAEDGIRDGHVTGVQTCALPIYILELKNKYVITDLTITSKFKSGFSWVLYDYLKAHYGYWNKKVTKDEMMKLFSVENNKSYQANTSRFKQSVRSEEHTSELQSRGHLVCRLLLDKKKKKN